MNLLNRIIQEIVARLLAFSEKHEIRWLKLLIYKIVFYLSINYVRLYFLRLSVLSFFYENYPSIILGLMFSIFILILTLAHYFLLCPEYYIPPREKAKLGFDKATGWRLYLVSRVVFLFFAMLWILLWYFISPYEVMFFYFVLGDPLMHFMESLAIVTFLLSGFAAAIALRLL